LYIQEYSGVSAASEDDPLVHLFGEKTIEEHLLGKRFSVSPGAFFQVNTPGAETLYSLVRQHANADLETLLYDVCCGTGTIGICASKGVGKVVGIEICKAATDDAAVNATLNGVENVTFINSKAEDVMKDLLKTKRGEGEQHLNKVVAIVDPPRAGLHHQVLRALRGCPPVQRIVYVSCNPTNSLVQDAMTLCGPKTKSIQGEAFQPVYAIPVDLFPHTPHCEMIIVFERVQASAE
jgi:tRNA (uracil-5-)-methyltransferase